MDASSKEEEEMIRTVEKGKTLLVDGPASVCVVSGQVDVFGLTSGNTNKIVIREGKRLPFVVVEKATFEISLGGTSNLEEADGNTIPPSWNEASQALLSIQKKPIVSVVLGAVDSGKTSFCTFLINNALREKRKVSILDGDLGQSDVGPPCTVGYACATKPTTDLFNLRAKNAFFVGVTSPSNAVQKVIDGISLLQKEILGGDSEIVIINTDGWVEGQDAVDYKIRLVETLNPDLVFCLQKKDELATILKDVGRFRQFIIESPSTITERSKERRKNLRELGYVKYLRNAKVQSVPLNWVKIEEDELFGLSKTYENVARARKIYELLGMKPFSLIELQDKVNVIIGKNRWIESENVKNVEELTKKKLVIIRKGEEEGLLTAMYNADRRFLGIGVLQEIDYLRRIMKILTPVSEEISTIVMGKVKLDKNLKEVPSFAEENQVDFKSFKELF
jgi:polynucleotide 5'-hydroxyl-kinase GRC3/NOL9